MKINFIIYISTTIIKLLLGFFFLVPFNTYYLSADDYGAFSLFTLATVFVTPLCSTGFSWVLSANYYQEDPKEQKIIISNLLLISVILFLFWISVFFVFRKYVFDIYNIENTSEHSVLFLLCLLSLFLNGIWAILSYVLILKKKAISYSFIDLFGFVAGVLSSILCLAILNLKVITLFINPLVSGGGICLMAFFLLRKDISYKISIKWIKETIVRGLPDIIPSSIEIICNNSDRYFVNRYLNLSGLGIYAHSKQYQQLYMMGIKAFIRTYIPELIQNFSKNERKVNEKLSAIMSCWLWFILTCGIFIELFSFNIIDLMTHGKFVAAAPLISVWAIYLFTMVYSVQFTHYLMYKKETKTLIFTMALPSLVFIPITGYAVYKLGTLGAVISMVLANSCIHLLRFIYSRKKGYVLYGTIHFLITFLIFIAIILINNTLNLNFQSKILLALMFAIIDVFIIFKILKQNEIDLKYYPQALFKGI